MRKWMAGAISVAMLLVGCGASDDYANDPRPPRVRSLAVSVTNDRIAISPSRIGAGPAVLIVSNQSDTSRDVTLTPPEGSSSACVDADASSGPINPMGTARVTVNLVEGDCILSVRDERTPRPARLTVGRERPSAQAELLLP